MGEDSAIQWTHHTFNTHIGCAKVHAGCLNCYAEADMDKRKGRAKWGPHGTRSITSTEYWRKPLKWDREAAAAGVRARVFCSSLADVFEDWQGPIVNAGGQVLFDVGDFNWRPESEINRRAFPGFSENDLDYRVTLNDVRLRLFVLIDKTPNLDWQLLTKRPENILKMWTIPDNGRDAGDDLVLRRDNVWLGTSISDQETANKAIPELLKCRELAPVLFLSAEPLLGPIDLIGPMPSEDRVAIGRGHPTEIDWVIVGGESGPQARPCETEWIWSLVAQCGDADIACFVKQLGSHAILDIRYDRRGTGWSRRLSDPKGGNPSEWPTDLQDARHFPVNK